jgi:hypothetical protein
MIDCQFTIVRVVVKIPGMFKIVLVFNFLNILPAHCRSETHRREKNELSAGIGRQRE